MNTRSRWEPLIHHAIQRTFGDRQYLRITGLAYPFSNLPPLRATLCVLLERGQICAVSGAIGYGYPLHVHDRLIS